MCGGRGREFGRICGGRGRALGASGGGGGKGRTVDVGFVDHGGHGGVDVFGGEFDWRWQKGSVCVVVFDLHSSEL